MDTKLQMTMKYLTKKGFNKGKKKRLCDDLTNDFFIDYLNNIFNNSFI